MRTRTLIQALIACASLASASSVETWSSSTADTTTVHVNTGGSKTAVGALVTGSNATAVRADATGINATALKATVSGGGSTTAVKAKVIGSGTALVAEVTGTVGTGIVVSAPEYGVHATASNGVGVHAAGLAMGVYGYSFGGEGVMGWTGDGRGVFGFAEDEGTGVQGSAAKSGTGVYAQSKDGNGAYAASLNGIGLNAASTKGIAVNATSTEGTGIVASGYDYGGNISSTNLYGTGLRVTGGGRGTGLLGIGYFGVYGYSYSWDGDDPAYGVVGDAHGGNGAYGVVGFASGGDSGANWAGFFAGDVYVGGYFDNPSDQQFKTNIRDYRGGLDKILALRIRSYDMKVDEFKDRIYLPSGPQIGVIAQEAEKVFPEIVRSTVAPVRQTPEERKRGVEKEEVKFKSVSYNALIPVLVQAIQELQAEVDALKAAQAGGR